MTFGDAATSRKHPRILFITDTRGIGGAERYLTSLADGYAAAGHEVVVLCPQRGLADWIVSQAPSVKVHVGLSDSYHDLAFGRGRGTQLARQLAPLVKAIRTVNPAIVHINNGGFPGSDLCRLAALGATVARVPGCVMTVHSNPWSRQRLSSPWFQAAADRLVWANVDAVICPSDAVAHGLVARRGMPHTLGRTIYYGVREATADPAEVARLKTRLAPNGELLVGMVSARPVPEKGYDVFVEALAQVGRGIKAILVGPRPSDFLAKLSSLDLEGRVVWVGSRPNVSAFYVALDLLVVPSTAEECMPLVILEAASATTPTFGSRLSGIPEAIVDGVTGRLFEPGSADELARLIDEAASDRATVSEMGSAARRRWEQRFTVAEMLAQTERTYS